MSITDKKLNSIISESIRRVLSESKNNQAYRDKFFKKIFDKYQKKIDVINQKINELQKETEDEFCLVDEEYSNYAMKPITMAVEEDSILFTFTSQYMSENKYSSDIEEIKIWYDDSDDTWNASGEEQLNEWWLKPILKDIKRGWKDYQTPAEELDARSDRIANGEEVGDDEDED